jgi:hypothetical protein
MRSCACAGYVSVATSSRRRESSGRLASFWRKSVFAGAKVNVLLSSTLRELPEESTHAMAKRQRKAAGAHYGQLRP